MQLPLSDLLRQSVYSRLAGYEDVNDAERLSQDPTCRLIGSKKILQRGAALTSRLQSFETGVLTQEDNLGGLAALNRELIARVEAIASPRRIVLDMDSTKVAIYGQQEQSAYNGHFEFTCFHPLPQTSAVIEQCLRMRPGKASFRGLACSPEVNPVPSGAAGNTGDQDRVTPCGAKPLDL